MSRDNPLRQIPQLYGKARGVRPARWLSHSEASEQLIGACRDGTDLGLRDEALIRLGLAGMRAAEIFRLRVGDLRLHDAEARIEWVGKRRLARVIVAGPSLIATLDAMFDRWQQLLGRPLRPDEPVICCGKSGAGSGLLIPDQPIAQTSRCGRSSPAELKWPDSGTSLLTTCGEPPPGLAPVSRPGPVAPLRLTGHPEGARPLRPRHDHALLPRPARYRRAQPGGRGPGLAAFDI